LSSSPIDPLQGLADLADDAAGDSLGMLALLSAIAGPRHRRGMRHRRAVILALGVCAMLAGARSFSAIAEWAADADTETLARMGVADAVPSESTFRRTTPVPGQGRVIAVDGKTVRGSGHGSRHLPSALDHAHGAVLGQSPPPARRPADAGVSDRHVGRRHVPPPPSGGHARDADHSRF
jgi:DDE_Tnp_1-associated